MDSLDTMRPPCRLSIFRLTAASGLQYKKNSGHVRKAIDR